MNFASKLRQLVATGISRPAFLPVLVALCGASIQAADTNQDRSLLTLDRIFAKREFKAEDWGPARWLKDNSGYTTLEKSEKTKDAKDVVRYEPASGKREVIIAASALVPPGATKPLRIEDYAWSDDSSKLLLFTNSKRVWRKNTKGDYWVYDLKTGKLQKLGGKAPASSLMFAAFSPDALKVGYVCQNNIYVQELKSLRVKQLTDDGSETIINGTSDWVYEEEFRLRDCFRWSPDSKYIAYWQFDTSGVRQFSLINNTDGPYPQVTSFAYPKAGETNSACRVGIVKATGGRTRWFRTNPDPRNHYIPELTWRPDSQAIVFQQMNRLQSTNQLIQADRSGNTRVLFVDRDESWVEAAEEWHWLEGGKRMLWLSERDGWQHLYSVSCTNGDITLLTPGEYDVVSIAGIDESARCAYIIAGTENVTQRYLYRVSLDRSAPPERVSPQDQPGTHSYNVSEDCRWAFHTYSRFGQPPRMELVSLPDHKISSRVE